MRQHRRLEDDDDSPFDKRGVLKDGRSIRTPMYLMDATQRGVREHFQQVTDGSSDGAGLHRPGPRYIADAAMRDAKQQALDEYQRDVENAWRADAKETWGEVGDQCTVRAGGRDEGSPGHLRRIGNRLVCVPDRPQRDAQTRDSAMMLDELQRDHQVRMQRIYNELDRELEQRWRAR